MVSKREVANATNPFLGLPRGGGGGGGEADGFRALHLLDMTSKSAGAGGELLLCALTTFSNFYG